MSLELMHAGLESNEFKTRLYPEGQLTLFGETPELICCSGDWADWGMELPVMFPIEFMP